MDSSPHEFKIQIYFTFTFTLARRFVLCTFCSGRSNARTATASRLGHKISINLKTSNSSFRHVRNKGNTTTFQAVKLHKFLDSRNSRSVTIYFYLFSKSRFQVPSLVTVIINTTSRNLSGFGTGTKRSVEGSWGWGPLRLWSLGLRSGPDRRLDLESFVVSQLLNFPIGTYQICSHNPSNKKAPYCQIQA